MKNDTDFKKGWMELVKLLLFTFCHLLYIITIFSFKDRMDNITASFVLCVAVSVAVLLVLSYLWFKWFKSYKEYRYRS